MMKKVFGTMIVAAAMFASYSAYDAQNESDLTGTVLANVEALAYPVEDDNGNIYECSPTNGICMYALGIPLPGTKI